MVPHVESKPIMQPFGDRSKVVIEPMLTDQWYAEKIVGKALDAVRNGDVAIPPEAAKPITTGWKTSSLVHLAPPLVGAPDPGVVRPR
ncbi:MAG: hypothetical protein R3D78_10770 [Paracoccaceae bacterium]